MTKITKDIYNKLKQEYLIGEKSISKIAKENLVNRYEFGKLLRAENINTKIDQHKRRRKYKIDESFFDKIDSQEKAYMLGFIYADGTNDLHSNFIRIQLSIVDKDILQKFSKIIYNEEILKYIFKKQNSGKGFEYVSFNIYSKYICEQMNNLGVVPNKSYKIEFPQWLDKDLHNHFVRGLIDGDGWISLTSNKGESHCVGLISSRIMNNYLDKYFCEYIGVKSFLSKANEQDFEKMCELRIKGYERCKIFLDWLYRDANIYLDRKYNLYLKFLDMYKSHKDN